jgi:hypothetical protein
MTLTASVGLFRPIAATSVLYFLTLEKTNVPKGSRKTSPQAQNSFFGESAIASIQVSRIRSPFRKG